MAKTISVSETIEAPAERVWETLTDWPNAIQWMDGIDSMSIDGETATGARVIFQARGKERESVITACEAGRLVTLRSSQGPVTADYTYEIEPLDESRCRVSLEAECRFSGLAKLMSPIIGMAIRRADGGQIAALKSVVEG